MITTLRRVVTLLVAVAILLTGHGLQLTLLPMHAAGQGWTTNAIGLSGATYFLGFIVGCLTIPGVIGTVGHIRTFMVMGAIGTVALLAAGLFVWLPGWMLFRFATGFAFSGLYMVIESWLTEVSPPQNRGRVLGVYTMIALVGMSAGQALLGFGTADSIELFMLGAGILCLGIIPIGLTRMPTPKPPPVIRLRASSLMAIPAVATVAAISAGMVTGAFWALGPVLGTSYGLNPAGVGILMSAGIIGGALSQLPVGLVSDHVDRRLVIGVLMLTGAAVAALGWFFASLNAYLLYATIFFIGAGAFPLYALCIAYSADFSEITLVEITGSILIFHSLGSLVGPVVVAPAMDHFGAGSFFFFVVTVLLLAGLWTLIRWLVIERPMEHSHAYMLPRTTHIVGGLSPEEHNPVLSRTNR